MRTFVIQSNRGVEQLVARRAHNPEAGGSSPSPATKKTDVEKSASVCRRMCAETEMFHARYLVRVFWAQRKIGLNVKSRLICIS